MTARECKLCHNWCPVEEFSVPSRVPNTFYNHPNCAECRAMLESFGITQKAPW